MKKITALFLLIVFFACRKEQEYPTPDISEIYFQDREVQTVFKNRTDGINIIFIGDGYVQKDLEKERGLYQRDGLKHIEFVFNNPPFSEYKEYFNAYVIYAESVDPGPSYDSRTRSTAFGVIQGEFFPEQFQENKIVSYVKKLVPQYQLSDQKNFILLSINNGIGGRAWIEEGLAVFRNNDEDLMLHELGHIFGKLGDEYEVHQKDSITSYDTNKNPNLDNTNDLTKIKWNQFVGFDNYEAVGAFEGGGYLSKGIWRPEENSIMRETWGNYPYFNAPSREAIVRRIKELSGQSYSFDEFLVKDKIALDTINSRSKRARKTSQSYICGNHLN